MGIPVINESAICEAFKVFWEVYIRVLFARQTVPYPNEAMFLPCWIRINLVSFRDWLVFPVCRDYYASAC
jgi:hypothetical protein